MRCSTYLVATGMLLLACFPSGRRPSPWGARRHRPAETWGIVVRRRPLRAALLLVGLSLCAGAQPALADHSSPVLTYTPKRARKAR